MTDLLYKIQLLIEKIGKISEKYAYTLQKPVFCVKIYRNVFLQVSYFI